VSGPGKFACDCAKGWRFEKKAKKCVEIDGCASNPCSKWAVCSKTQPGQFSCKCRKGFSGDGVRCQVQEGSKAIMLNGKVEIVPVSKGDKHDADLSVIEAMLGRMVAEDPAASSSAAQAFGDNNAAAADAAATTTSSASAASATSAAASASASSTSTPSATAAAKAAADPDRLDRVRRRVLTLEQTTEALAEAAKKETEELAKLREQSAADNARVLQALNAKADVLMGVVTDATHDIMVTTPRPAASGPSVATPK